MNRCWLAYFNSLDVSHITYSFNTKMHGNNETLSLQRPLLHININIINFRDSEDDPCVPEMAIITQKPRKILTEANLLILGFGCSAEVTPACRGLISVVVMTHLCCCSSVTKSCSILCDRMDCSMTGFPVLHYLPEFSQTHVHWVDDAIQPSHPLLPTSPVFNLPQHQGLFKWISSSQQMTKDLELQLQSFQWILRTDFL